MHLTHLVCFSLKNEMRSTNLDPPVKENWSLYIHPKTLHSLATFGQMLIVTHILAVF